MTLNSVDLPQPEGPMIERNSPGFTASDTWSTAVTGPPGVGKLTTTSSTDRIASLSPRLRRDGIEVTSIKSSHAMRTAVSGGPSAYGTSAGKSAAAGRVNAGSHSGSLFQGTEMPD